jgi:ankyrin
MHNYYDMSTPLVVSFLVSFLVDARGGAMRGCRHSGVRVIVPPRKAAMPMRVTCRYLRKDKLSNPPPLMEGEALASRILELGPVGAKFLGYVVITVTGHNGSMFCDLIRADSFSMFVTVFF